MNKIAVICAMQVELDAIKKLLSNLEEITIGPRTFYKGTFNSKEIILVKCGIGKVNAAITTTLLINEFEQMRKRLKEFSSKTKNGQFDPSSFGFGS